MKKLLPLIITSLTLSACAYVPPATSFKDSELYQGYPCTDHCQEFQQGYELALNNKIVTESDCVGDNLDVITGCKAYVSDYRFDHQEADLYF